MKKVLGYFFLVVTFIMGTSIGLYTGTQMNTTKNISQNNRVEDSIQDIVLQKVQNDSFGENKELENTLENKEDIVIAVSLNEEKSDKFPFKSHDPTVKQLNAVFGVVIYKPLSDAFPAEPTNKIPVLLTIAST